MADNPYSPPETDPVSKQHDGPPCPKCGQAMEEGHLLCSTSLRWVGNSQSFIRKNLLGGQSLGSKANRFGGRYPGYSCQSCQLYLLKQ